MDAMIGVLLAVALAGQPTYYGTTPPETQGQRAQRLELIASVDVEVAHSDLAGFDPRDSAALLLAIQIHESKLDYYVHAGLDSPIGHQDHGKARCLGQIHTWPGNPHLQTAEDHRALAGLDRAATSRCASTMLKYLWGHARRCVKRANWDAPLTDREVALIAAAYGTGYCTAPKASNRARARTFRRIRTELSRGA